MVAVSFSIKRNGRGEPSLFDLSGRTPQRNRPTLNSHTRMMGARPGKSTGLRIRHGRRLNLTRRTELCRGSFHSVCNHIAHTREREHHMKSFRVTFAAVLLAAVMGSMATAQSS